MASVTRDPFWMLSGTLLFIDIDNSPCYNYYENNDDSPDVNNNSIEIKSYNGNENNMKIFHLHLKIDYIY